MDISLSTGTICVQTNARKKTNGKKKKNDKFLLRPYVCLANLALHCKCYPSFDPKYCQLLNSTENRNKVNRNENQHKNTEKSVCLSCVHLLLWDRRTKIHPSRTRTDFWLRHNDPSSSTDGISFHAIIRFFPSSSLFLNFFCCRFSDPLKKQRHAFVLPAAAVSFMRAHTSTQSNQKSMIWWFLLFFRVMRSQVATAASHKKTFNEGWIILNCKFMIQTSEEKNVRATNLQQQQKKREENPTNLDKIMFWSVLSSDMNVI